MAQPGYPPMAQPGVPPMAGAGGVPVQPMQGYVMTPQGYLAPQFYTGKRKPVKNLPGTYGKFNGGFFSDILEDLRGIYIRERTDWAEALTGCAQEKHFCVQNIDAKNGAILLRCQEKSECCQRVCWGGACRAFEVDVTNCFDGKLHMKIEREFSCTFMCCNRPFASIFVYDENMGKHPIG